MQLRLHKVIVSGQWKVSKHRSRKRSQDSPSESISRLQHCGSCVPLYMSEPLPLHFPSAEHLLLVFFFPMCCFCPNWSLHMDARKLICAMRLSPKTGLRFTNKMLQSGRSFFLRSDHSRLWFGNEETFSSHDSRPYFPFYSVQTQATKTRSHPVLQWITLEIMEVKWARLII